MNNETSVDEDSRLTILARTFTHKTMMHFEEIGLFYLIFIVDLFCMLWLGGALEIWSMMSQSNIKSQRHISLRLSFVYQGATVLRGFEDEIISL